MHTQAEIIKKLAIVGCNFMGTEGMTAISVAKYSEACGDTFDLTDVQRREIISKMVMYAVNKH